MGTLREYWSVYYSKRREQTTLDRAKRLRSQTHRYKSNMAPCRDALKCNTEPGRARDMHLWRKRSQVQKTACNATATEKTPSYDRSNSADDTNPVEMLRAIFAEYNIEETPLEVLEDARRRV